MRPVVLSPPAESDPLARELERRVFANLKKPELRRIFARMWATVVVVCRPGPSSSGEGAGHSRGTTLTLRFDYGLLTIHEGRVGRPDVTLWGTAEEILGLSFVRTFLPGVGVQVFGKGAHPRLVYRLVRILDDGS